MKKRILSFVLALALLSTLLPLQVLQSWAQATDGRCMATPTARWDCWTST